MLGVLEGHVPKRKPAAPGEDAEMAEDGKPTTRYLTGRTEIGFYRENIAIQPLFQEDNTSKSHLAPLTPPVIRGSEL